MSERTVRLTFDVEEQPTLYTAVEQYRENIRKHGPTPRCDSILSKLRAAAASASPAPGYGPSSGDPIDESQRCVRTGKLALDCPLRNDNPYDRGRHPGPCPDCERRRQEGAGVRLLLPRKADNGQRALVKAAGEAERNRMADAFDRKCWGGIDGSTAVGEWIRRGGGDDV